MSQTQDAPITVISSTYKLCKRNVLIVMTRHHAVVWLVNKVAKRLFVNSASQGWQVLPVLFVWHVEKSPSRKIDESLEACQSGSLFSGKILYLRL